MKRDIEFEPVSEEYKVKNLKTESLQEFLVFLRVNGYRLVRNDAVMKAGGHFNAVVSVPPGESHRFKARVRELFGEKVEEKPGYPSRESARL
jgi:hypothetical protein